LKHASDTLMQNINTIQQYQTSNFTEIEQLKADNELLTSTNSQITKEHENLIKQISEQSQEIFTIKSILQLNNIV
jgi:FtsZ-binding cell division protein ZapB